MKKTIIIVGAGPGLGNHIAKRFGQEEFRVILMARSLESLESYRQELEKQGIETHVYTADAANPQSLADALNKATHEFGAPDLLVYNVGITSLDKPEIHSHDLMHHYQVDVASAYLSAKIIATDEFAKKKGAIIFTGGGLAIYPIASFTPLSIDKAALRALARLLHDEMQPKGIFVGTVTVSGEIGYDAFFAPTKIAEAYWQMYNERKDWEILYEYPELKDCHLEPTEYWKKVYEIAEMYK